MGDIDREIGGRGEIIGIDMEIGGRGYFIDFIVLICQILLNSYKF